MEEKFNVLILSGGTRNKLVQYFKKELNGRGEVIVTDCNHLAPALYEADDYFIVPRIDDENYLNKILTICKEKEINIVLSLIDPELILIAENKEAFLAVGTTPVISSLELVELSFNKFNMHRFLVNNDFNSIKSYIDKDAFYKDLELEKIKFPVFVKPVDGSASNNINLLYTIEEVELVYEKNENLLIQEYMDGKEYGADVYIDELSLEPISIFVKEKIKMRGGETDKSVSVKNYDLLYLIAKFVKIAGYQGVIDIDIFEKNGEYFISEVNPRFGGGYPHAHESGVNFPNFIINNHFHKKENKNQIGQYESDIYMMKYNEIKILHTDKTKQTSNESDQVIYN